MSKKGYILLLLLILSGGRTGDLYAQNKEVNVSDRYGILTVTPFEKHTGQAALLKTNSTRASVVMSYGDAFGGVLQKTQVGVTPAGNDLTESYEYDALTRLSSQGLPVPTAGKGTFIVPNNVLLTARSYYGESNVSSRNTYESSHRDLIVSKAGAGDAFAGREVKVRYDYNHSSSTPELYCRKYEIGINSVVESATPYKEGSLKAMRTENEDGQVQWAFTNDRNQLILSRVINGNEYLDTYYVYDRFEDLRYVLTPMYQQNPNLSLYAYQYVYDAFGRVTSCKVPGAQAIYTMHDGANRVVFSQDGNQSLRDVCSFFLFDEYGRPVVTGECTNDSFPDDNTVVKATLSNTASGLGGSGYSSSFALINPEVNTVNYYDNYAFLQREGFSGFDAPANNAYAVGSITGSKTRVLGTNDFIYTVNYYDIKGQVIKTISTHLMGGKEKQEIEYSFSGKPLKVTHSHIRTGGETITEKYVYTYDNADRLVKVTHQLNNGTAVVLNENEYNELCLLKEKKFHNGTNTATYDYNIRGWLTAIRGNKFTQEVHYTDGKGTPSYTGNISSMLWKAGNEQTFRGYCYTYDLVNRMTDAVYGEGTNLASNPNRFNEQVTSYDRNGNILGLKRQGHTADGGYGLIDNLTITLKGNLLQKVKDNAVNAAYADEGIDFKDQVDLDTEYEYDYNGNLIKDLNKKITNIQYNYLNLPASIQFEDGSRVSYLYYADGKKLRVTHVIGGTTTTTDYCGKVVYENGSPKTLLTENGFISLKDGRYHYYLQDHQGNNRVVVDQDGNVEEANHYYPFGGVFASTSSVQSYKYNGKEFDRKKGLDWYDYGVRMYDPTLGRWNAVDPMAEDNQNLTPYNYCSNNPIKFVDRDGMEADDPIINLPEVTVVGKRVADPVSGFWNTVAYFLLGRTHTVPVYGIENGNQSVKPIGYITYNVNRKGIATDIAPIGGIAPSPATKGLSVKDIAKLLKAGKVVSKAGLTAVGRGLQKHGSRTGSTFPKAIGNQAAINQQGENVLKSILENPNVERTINSGTLNTHRYGVNSVDYQIPGGIGARFNSDGTKFIGFLEPK